MFCRSKQRMTVPSWSFTVCTTVNFVSRTVFLVRDKGDNWIRSANDKRSVTSLSTAISLSSRA